MLMVIFGAGASYDSAASRPIPSTPDVRDYPDRPPLANYLFHPQQEFGQIVQNYKPLIGIVDRLRDLGNESIETRLQRLRDESVTYPVRYRQLAAIKFYLRDVLLQCSKGWRNRVHSATNFGPLLDDIRKWHVKRRVEEPVCLVTFNYDLLLEHALLDAGCGFQMNRMDHYISSPGIFNLFKLHGSVNWARCTDRYTPEKAPGPNDIIDQAELLRATDEFIITGESNPTLSQGRWLMPAIAIPVQTKSDFECPNSHIEKLQSTIPYITELVVIGWKGREANFIKMLNQDLRKLQDFVVVDANKQAASIVAEALKGELKTALDGVTLKVAEKGFSHFIRSGESETFFGP